MRQILRRQRLILATLHCAGRAVGRTELMKWLFLMREEPNYKRLGPFFDFVPYKFGPFSFVVYRDIRKLVDAGFLSEDPLRVRGDALRRVEEAVESLDRRVLEVVRRTLAATAHLSAEALVTQVYDHHPWYASRSEARAKPETDSRAPAAFTVGYEGECIDAFLAKLIRERIVRIIDVRCNPISRKWGFSKTALRDVCGRIGVEYMHFRELGIPSALRANLKTEAEYQRLFARYRREILRAAEESAVRVGALQLEMPSALLCYEADPGRCHRTHLAEHVRVARGLSVLHLQTATESVCRSASRS